MKLSRVLMIVLGLFVFVGCSPAMSMNNDAPTQTAFSSPVDLLSPIATAVPTLYHRNNAYRESRGSSVYRNTSTDIGSRY